MRAVGYVARGYPERAYAKWLVTHFLWTHLKPEIFARSKQDIFRVENESWTQTFWALTNAATVAFRAVLAFYRTKRGKGAKAIDVSTFFQRRKLDIELEKFWFGSANKHRLAFKSMETLPDHLPRSRRCLTTRPQPQHSTPHDPKRM